MAIFHQAENIIMERFMNLVVTNLLNRWPFSGTKILKTIIFYVASEVSSQPIIEESGPGPIGTDVWIRVTRVFVVRHLQQNKKDT